MLKNFQKYPFLSKFFILLQLLAENKEKLTALSSWDLHSTHEAIEQTAAELEVGMGKKPIGIDGRCSIELLIGIEQQV